MTSLAKSLIWSVAFVIGPLMWPGAGVAAAAPDIKAAAKPRVPKSTADHSKFEALKGPFANGPALTKACLGCHTEAATQVQQSIHWTWEYHHPVTGQILGKKRVINSFCGNVPSNEPRCTSCHAGYGWTDEKTFDFKAQANVDCVVCHDKTGTYQKWPTKAGHPLVCAADRRRRQGPRAARPGEDRAARSACRGARTAVPVISMAAAATTSSTAICPRHWSNPEPTCRCAHVASRCQLALHRLPHCGRAQVAGVALPRHGEGRWREAQRRLSPYRRDELPRLPRRATASGVVDGRAETQRPHRQGRLPDLPYPRVCEGWCRRPRPGGTGRPPAS